MYQLFVNNVIYSSLNVFNNIEELIHFFVSCKHQTHYPLSRPISITFKCIKIIKANSYLYSVSRHDDFYVVWMYEKVYCFSIMLFRCLTDTHYFWGQIKKKNMCPHLHIMLLQKNYFVRRHKNIIESRTNRLFLHEYYLLFYMLMNR